MHLWALTQHYADFDVQVRHLMRLKPGEPVDREHIAEEAVAFVLAGCGLEPGLARAPSRSRATGRAPAG